MNYQENPKDVKQAWTNLKIVWIKSLKIPELLDWLQNLLKK